MAFSSYQDAPQSGEVKITLDINKPLIGLHVLVLEGVIITGRTPLYIMNMLRLRCPSSIEICAIAHKPNQLTVPLNVKYSLFEFNNEWVVGYGVGDGQEKSSPDLINIAAC
jgi:hypoxanthine phosphoribosyltransferase